MTAVMPDALWAGDGSYARCPRTVPLYGQVSLLKIKAIEGEKKRCVGDFVGMSIAKGKKTGGALFFLH